MTSSATFPFGGVRKGYTDAHGKMILNHNRVTQSDRTFIKIIHRISYFIPHLYAWLLHLACWYLYLALPAITLLSPFPLNTVSLYPQPDGNLNDTSLATLAPPTSVERSEPKWSTRLRVPTQTTKSGRRSFRLKPA